jgi:hypothetical protein
MYVNTGRFFSSNPLIKESIAKNEFYLMEVHQQKE